MYKEYDVLGAGEEELKPVDELDNGTEPSLLLDQLCNEFERQNLSDEVCFFWSSATGGAPLRIHNFMILERLAQSRVNSF